VNHRVVSARAALTPSRAAIVTSRTEVARDCPECRSAGSVVGARCQICDAPEGQSGAADLPPAVPAALRMSDVLAELGAIREALAEPGEAAAACLRVEALFQRLRNQFLSDVVLGDVGFLEPRPGPA
jgi:hypothetical protein